MPSLNDVKDRLVIFRDERGETTSKIIAGGLVIACLAGAYLTGKRVERQWWRSEIASKSQAVRTIMGKLSEDAPDFDERLIQEWSREHVEPLKDAERKLAEAHKQAQSRPQETVGRDACTLPAHCLRDR